MLIYEEYEVIDKIKRDVIEHGYVFVQEFFPESEIVTLASELGRPLAPWKGEFVQDLVPRVISTPNTYSGVYGIGDFPFHTDLAHWAIPPRYLMLRCVIGYGDVNTQLVEFKSLLDAVTMDTLNRALFKPRRPTNGSLSLFRLCESTDYGLRFRWDELFLKPASRLGEVVRDSLKAKLAVTKPSSISLIKSGDTLLIDNWRMLHSRTQIPNNRQDRRIQRVYLESLH